MEKLLYQSVVQAGFGKGAHLIRPLKKSKTVNLTDFHFTITIIAF